MQEALLEELTDWLRIPSISTGDSDPADLRRAAEWVVERVRSAGGECEVLETAGNPLAVGELHAVRPGAPTVLIYGHYDVQSVGDPAAWETPPFEPAVRDGRLYARGASDDKGNFLPLLHVACELAEAGELPVNVRILVEGEEETGGESVAEWVRADQRGADAALVFDSDMADERTPAITAGLRGMVQADVSVRTAERDLHSGLYGGSVLNALHVLHAMVAEVMPGLDGRLRDELRAGIEEPAPAERMRLAPRQRAEEIKPVVERLLRGPVPDGAEVEIEWYLADPSLFDVDQPAIQLAAGALERACGARPVMQRSGGSIPVVAELAAAGIPTVVVGFALADDAIHAPNESYRLESLRLGDAAARELYAALAGLPR
jgi:acetylornithine deacetylase/succinyl-diaminopimelate desuccinylase-like protein